MMRSGFILRGEVLRDAEHSGTPFYYEVHGSRFTAFAWILVCIFQRVHAGPPTGNEL